jgi:hypothetical protein
MLDPLITVLPEAHRMQTERLAAVVCRGTLAFSWVYQGLIQKLMGPHSDELKMDLALGVSLEQARIISYGAGVMEVGIGIAIVLFSRSVWPLWITILAMIGFLAYVGAATPDLLVGAFNAPTINTCMAGLAVVAIMLERSREGSGI